MPCREVAIYSRKQNDYRGRETSGNPYIDSLLKDEDCGFGLSVTTAVEKVLPVVNPSCESSHRSFLQKLRGSGSSCPLSVITTIFVGPGTHWH